MKNDNFRFFHFIWNFYAFVFTQNKTDIIVFSLQNLLLGILPLAVYWVLKYQISDIAFFDLFKDGNLIVFSYTLAVSYLYYAFHQYKDTVIRALWKIYLTIFIVELFLLGSLLSYNAIVEIKNYSMMFFLSVLLVFLSYFIIIFFYFMKEKDITYQTIYDFIELKRMETITRKSVSRKSMDNTLKVKT